ncbi:hypothetical protein TRVA0_017S01420 [Trichomonascus vanleenenianus]|uniref:uncharacterized protein n=1 Tax=Trichomonascus vanleenenianus TaxID=2268995 RepID=UPI003ECAD148
MRGRTVVPSSCLLRLGGCRPAFPRLDRRHTSTSARPVEDTARLNWSLKCKELAKSERFSELNEFLAYGKQLGYSMYPGHLKRVMYVLASLKRFDLAGKIFRTHSTENIAHKSTIFYALVSARRLCDFDQCRRIYNRYHGKVSFSREAYHMALDGFYADYDFSRAQEIIWNDMGELRNEATLREYIHAACRIGNNVEGAYRFFREWKDVRQLEVSTASYAVMLENLVLRGAEELFNELAATLNKTTLRESAIEHVYVLQALLHQNEKEVQKRINKLALHRTVLTQRPFIEAIKHFSAQGDVQGLGFAVGALNTSGFQIEIDVLNYVVSGLYRQDKTFELVRFLHQLKADDMTGNRNTLEWLVKALAGKYPTKGLRVLKWAREFKEAGVVLPRPRIASIHQNDKRIVVEGGRTRSQQKLLSNLRYLIKQDRLDQAERYLEEVKARGTIPIKTAYILLMRGIAQKGSLNDVKRVYRNMLDAGHEANVQIYILMLRRELAEARECRDDGILATRSDAISKINELLQLYPASDLSLQDRCSLARELELYGEYQKAVNLLDSHRDPSEPITLANHDSYSLTGLLRCYRKMKNYQGAIDTIEVLLDSRPTITLYNAFFHELNMCFVNACEHGTADHALQLYAQSRLCREYMDKLSEEFRITLHEITKHFNDL